MPGCTMALLAPLVLGAWLAAGAGGCLQCDRQIRSTLESLRTGLVPRQIRDSRLRARAQALLRGMEGGFFRHYATSQFAGTAGRGHGPGTSGGSLPHLSPDQALLDALVAFRRRTTMELKSALKEHQAKGTSSRGGGGGAAPLPWAPSSKPPNPPVLGGPSVTVWGYNRFFSLSPQLVTPKPVVS
uniref:Uncharacterized protein n=1 Tax=Chrysemys picta bellii TaxID=8478 RepID=A0A8C3FAQ7_CHRPI